MAGKDGGRGQLSRAVERRLREIEACARRGESVKAYAARTGQSVHTLYAARRQARRAGVLAPGGGQRRVRRNQRPRPRPRFVEARVAEGAPTASIPGPAVVWRLRLPGGAVLESTIPLDAAAFGTLLTAVGSRS